ncbi:hypothetical protein B0H13DRAFT_1929536 [Mycena leptocephala]|nr:hypothetical protein B0H13DRAFT_1929536 [Mycena leptocephala]
MRLAFSAYLASWSFASIAACAAISRTMGSIRFPTCLLALGQPSPILALAVCTVISFIVLLAACDISYIRNSAAALKALASTPAFQRHSNEHTGPTPTSSGYNTYDSVSSCWTASIGHVDERTDICRASSGSQTYGKYNSSCSEFRPHVRNRLLVPAPNEGGPFVSQSRTVLMYGGGPRKTIEAASLLHIY